MVGRVRGVDFDQHEVVDAVALAESLLEYMTWKDSLSAKGRQFLFQWIGLRLHQVDSGFVACAVAKIAFETLPFLPFIQMRYACQVADKAVCCVQARWFLMR